MAKDGKRLKKGELLCEATGSSWVGIEMGWAASAKRNHVTRFQEARGHYSGTPRATPEGTDFWTTLTAWMAKGTKPAGKQKP